MQNSYPYTYEDSDELWLKQEEILENPLENEAELERYIERERMRFYREWFQYTAEDYEAGFYFSPIIAIKYNTTVR